MVGLLATASGLAGAVRYVDDDAPAGGDGLAWETAYRFLADALADAGAPGSGIDEIRVAQGTYLADRSEVDPAGTADPAATFQLISGVGLRGGYAGLGAPDPDARDIDLYQTVLSGDIADGGPSSDCCFDNYPQLGCDDQACEDLVCAEYVWCCDDHWDLGCAYLADDVCGALCSSGDTWHVVTGGGTDSTAVLDGFTVTGGRADACPEACEGGGLYTVGGSPTITGCTFTGNEADVRGGAVYNGPGSSPAFTACTFTGNTADFGGAMANEGGSSPVLTSCAFTGNTARNGAGMHSSASAPELVGCTFSANVAYFGGGLADIEGSTTTLADCQFLGNEGEQGGGGIYSTGGTYDVTACVFDANNFGLSSPGPGGGMAVFGGTVTLVDCEFSGQYAYIGGSGLHLDESTGTLTRCTFRANQAQYTGGGLYNRLSDPVLVNCLFAGNSANIGKGGAIHNFASSPTLINCTLSDNFADGGGGGIYSNTDSSVTVANCILWGNSPSLQFLGPTEVFYSDVENYITPFNGNIHVDPVFVAPAAGDFRLSAGSPCIDAASNLAVPQGVTTDLDGNPRFVDDPDTPDTGNGAPPIVDMGAYEFRPDCIGDLDGSGDVGITDLLELLAAWGPNPGHPADLNGNGVVDINDFLELLAGWGPCP